MITAGDSRRLMKKIVYLSIVLVCFGDNAYAGGYDDNDFSLRFPAALSRFSSYADVAATGGASAGSKWQSSANPASIAWQRLPGSYRLSLNPQYSVIMFEEKTVLHVITESVTKEFDKFGTFQLAFAQVRSNDGDTQNLMGLKFFYDMDYVQAQWGKKLSDDFALGGNLNYSASKVKLKDTSLTFSETTSDTYGVRVGGLYRIAKNLLGGLVVDYSWSPSTTTYYDIYGFGIGDVRVKDGTDQFTLRLGPSYEYRKDSTVTVDYQYCSLRNDTGKMEVHRMLAGIDHRIIDALFIRGGVALDNDGNTSWTGGLGIYPFKALSIDLGYQYNMFPEIKREFGRSHLVTISIGIIL
jgi:hypothetical protein